MSRAVFVAVGVWKWKVAANGTATFSLTKKGAANQTIDASQQYPQVSLGDALIDDEVYGASTPRDEDGNGGIYVEMGYAKGKFPLPPYGYDKPTNNYSDRKYEFMTIQYSSGDPDYADRRYYGFHAIWIEGEDRKNATLIIFNAGDSKSGKFGAAKRYTLNLDEPKQVLPCSVYPPGFSKIRKRGDSGCIFLRCRDAKHADLLIPKLPQGLVKYRKHISCPPSEGMIAEIRKGDSCALANEFLKRMFEGKIFKAIGSLEPCCRDCESNDDLGKHFDAKTWLVSTQNANDELLDVLDAVRWEWLVEGRNGFMAYLHHISAMYAEGLIVTGKFLDLIDHSEKGNILSIGGDGEMGVQMSAAWLNSKNQQDLLLVLRNAIKWGMITGIRLLGCSTGVGAGEENIKALANLLGTCIWGTSRIIDHDDFDDGGLKHEVAQKLVFAPVTAVSS
jgi:hypothetical protein